MTANTTWGHQEDEDYLGNPTKIAAFDMPNLWDPDNDPHPNTKVMNTLMDFGKRYINSDPTGGTGFTPTVFKPPQHDSGTYVPPSQQTNNQGLLANTEKPAISPSPAIKYASVKVPDMSKPTVTQHQSASSTSPFSANLTKTLDSMSEADTRAGTATGDLLGAIGGQYLKRGNHDVFDMPNQAEATFTGDLLGTTAKATGRAIINSGSDTAQHDNQTDYNLHYSQNPEAYRQQVEKTMNDAGQAWMNNHDLEHRSNIETYGDDVELGLKKNVLDLSRITAKSAMVFNEALTEGAAKYENREILAHEVRRHRFEWEDGNAKMMTRKNIRTDTPENQANDTFKYLYQTGVSQYYVNLALVRAYRGAPFMMQDAVGMLDASFDIWADNIVERGDHNYLNALRETIEKNHPSTDDVLINLLSRFMGGANGDALMFMWNSMKENEKREMMKEVKQRQKAKLNNAP